MSAAQAVVQAGGSAVPRLMAAIEAQMSELAGGHGPKLALHAGETIGPGLLAQILRDCDLTHEQLEDLL